MSITSRILVLLVLLAQPLLSWSTHLRWCPCVQAASQNASENLAACAIDSGEACCCCSEEPVCVSDAATLGCDPKADGVCGAGCGTACEHCTCQSSEDEPVAPIAPPTRSDAPDSSPKFVEAAATITIVSFPQATDAGLAPLVIARADMSEPVADRLAKLCVWTM
jgi:hypothetical protein